MEANDTKGSLKGLVKPVYSKLRNRMRNHKKDCGCKECKK